MVNEKPISILESKIAHQVKVEGVNPPKENPPVEAPAPPKAGVEDVFPPEPNNPPPPPAVLLVLLAPKAGVEFVVLPNPPDTYMSDEGKID